MIGCCFNNVVLVDFSSRAHLLLLGRLDRSFENQDLSSQRSRQKYVDAFYGSTHERARLRGMRRGSLQHLLHKAVRPVLRTGQTGRRVETATTDEHSSGRGTPSGKVCAGVF
jgi:hypothetical protein